MPSTGATDANASVDAKSPAPASSGIPISFASVAERLRSFFRAVQRGLVIGIAGAARALLDPNVRRQLLISMGPLLLGSAAMYYFAPPVARRIDALAGRVLAMPEMSKIPLPRDYNLEERVRTARFTQIGLSFVRQVFSAPLDALFFAGLPPPSASKPASAEASRIRSLAPQSQKIPFRRAVALFGARTLQTQSVSLLAHFALGYRPIRTLVVPLLGSFYLYKTGQWTLLLLAAPLSLLPGVNLVQAFFALMGIRSMSRELLEPLLLRDPEAGKDKEVLEEGNNGVMLAAFTAPFYLLQGYPGWDALGFGLAQAAVAPLAAVMLAPGGVDAVGAEAKKGA
ncbi:hypothetical protein DFJ74DRAFT_706891 [Hyaloraphidium curvatum]|nr:hypothetical protein DFJ74DRAFT_706891 [Hyaloraphidium curvatum]